MMTDITTESHDHPSGIMVTVVYVGDEVLAAFACADSADHYAQRLAEARAATTERRAMQVLCGELGMCLTHASHVYRLLHNINLQ